MSDSFNPHDPEAAERAVAVLKVLSHAGRLRILCHLIERDMNVGELSEALDETQANISQQLMRLRAEGFVRPVRSGKNITYKLGRDDIAPVITALRTSICGPTSPRE
jgi:ArsR family transcriptional regulator, virulence genes transcriptional regulator